MSLVWVGNLVRSEEEKIEQMTADLDAEHPGNKAYAYPGSVQWPLAPRILLDNHHLTLFKRAKLENSPVMHLKFS